MYCPEGTRHVTVAFDVALRKLVDDEKLPDFRYFYSFSEDFKKAPKVKIVVNVANTWHRLDHVIANLESLSGAFSMFI